MTKELFVSSTPHETKVGMVEDDLLAEIYLERENEYTLGGSIYKGRVTRVLPTHVLVAFARERLVLLEAIAIQIAVVVDPLETPQRRVPVLAEERAREYKQFKGRLIRRGGAVRLFGIWEAED